MPEQGFTSPHPVALLAEALPTLFIVADDLTGASDSAAQFLERASNVRVYVGAQPPALSVIGEPGTVLAFSTESRNSTASEAAQAVERTFTAISGAENGFILFKKIDSAGRGQFAAEILSALAASEAKLALVAPSFPAQARTVVNGTLHIRDSSSQETSLDIRSLFPISSRSWLDVLPVADSADILGQGIGHAIQQGKRILICDAQTQHDLDLLATAAHRVAGPILWAGSAGLARSLAALYRPRNDGQQPELPELEGRTLLVVGTNHPVTAMQIDELHGSPGRAHPAVHRVEWDIASEASLRNAFAERPVQALILTGGDTAAFALKALHASAIHLLGQLAPGIPWGIIEGGDAAGCRVITKSGGFGQHDTLIDAFSFCSRRTVESA